MQIRHPDNDYTGTLYFGGAQIVFTDGLATVEDGIRRSLLNRLARSGYGLQFGAFDPLSHDVDEVERHLSGAADAERARVVAIEAARTDRSPRKTVMALAPKTDPDTATADDSAEPLDHFAPPAVDPAESQPAPI